MSFEFDDIELKFQNSQPDDTSILSRGRWFDSKWLECRAFAFFERGISIPATGFLECEDLGFAKGFNIDWQNKNDGTLGNRDALYFGGTGNFGRTIGAPPPLESGEGIASKRTTGGNQYGLDFFTNWHPRLSIDHIGNITMSNNLNTNGSIYSNINIKAEHDLIANDNIWSNHDVNCGRHVNSSVDVNCGRHMNIRGGDVNVHTGNINVLGRGDIILSNSDCAEDFDISQNYTVDPGTVVVLNEEGLLEPSQQPYDKKVAGVISGAGDYKPGIILGRQQSDNTRKPIALAGKVYCKIDAKSSAIKIGDLLTTSQTEGHAMKAKDPLKSFGAVIGKALGSIKDDLGIIPILVALQ